MAPFTSRFDNAPYFDEAVRGAGHDRVVEDVQTADCRRVSAEKEKKSETAISHSQKTQLFCEYGPVSKIRQWMHSPQGAQALSRGHVPYLDRFIRRPGDDRLARH